MIVACAAIGKRLLQPTERQDYLLLLCGMIFLSISLPLTFWPATGMETTFYIFMIMATYWRVFCMKAMRFLQILKRKFFLTQLS